MPNSNNSMAFRSDTREGLAFARTAARAQVTVNYHRMQWQVLMHLADVAAGKGKPKSIRRLLSKMGYYAQQRAEKKLANFKGEK